MYQILKKQTLNANTKLMVIDAPHVARKAEPGQFIILRVDADGERIPLTIADFDREKGAVTIIFQEVGATTMALGALSEGDCLHDFVGPLGKASEFDGMHKVAVVGGGNSAAADALLLSRICKKVILIHRRDSLRATKIYHDPLMQTDNIEFRWNSTVDQLLGDRRLSGVRLCDTLTGEETDLAVDGLFISIGRSPETALFAGQIELDDGGYIVADESTRTILPGVFAVGDVRTKAVRQVITAAADGAVAAHYAEQYLAENG